MIDSGGSPTTGERLRAAIRERTDLPIRYLINTHVHFDHLFGNGAFRDDGPELVAHARLQGALMSRADTYLARFRETSVGPEEARRVVMLPTDIPVSERLELGSGRPESWRSSPIRRPTPTTTSRCTTASTGTLFAGDLVSLNHIPIMDGSVLRWLEVMDQLAADSGASIVVPGHGPVTAPWPGRAGCRSAGIWRVMVAEIRALAKEPLARSSRRSAKSASDAAGQWVLFDEYHSRNVTAAFAELEWE